MVKKNGANSRSAIADATQAAVVGERRQLPMICLDSVQAFGLWGG
jgi:hypothetical protein